MRPVFASVLLLCACEGQISVGHPSSPWDPSGGGPGGAGSGSGAGDGSGGGAMDPVLPPNPHSMAPALIRRLDHTEYDNTVRDLLGDTTGPAAMFPADPRVGFENLSAVLTTSPALVQAYFDAAQALVATALLDATQSAKLLVCTPSANLTADACARRIITAFGARAWRRPLSTAEVGSLAALVTSSITAGDTFKDAVSLALVSMLMSPNFLYRPELDLGQTSGAPHPVSDWELASRLSYFLWSSMPDAELFAAAQAGTLHEPQALEAQARRMLSDPKAAAFLEALGSGWLLAGNVEKAHPSATVFPSFSAALAGSMEQETRRVLQAFFDEGRDATGLVDADFTVVDARLAAHYGLPAVGSFTRVSLAGTKRAGILAHGGFLTSSSTATRTSPTKRGKWVLEQVLCRTVAPPPPDVPPLANQMVAGSVRQQLEAHATNPVCAACHSQMDPIGFGLEHFDGVGAWRETDGAYAIDATGSLGAGRTFDGAVSLAGQLKADPALPACITRQVWSYASGRAAVSDDAYGLQGISKAARERGFSLSELAVAIVRSDSFTQRLTP